MIEVNPKLSFIITIQNENKEPPASINPAVFDSAAGKTI